MKRVTPAALHFLEEGLAQAARDGLLRERPPPLERSHVSFCSNDYLGLSTRTLPVAPVGAGASRLISGERAEHGALEDAAAELVGMEDALAFSSGYAANLGVLTALAGPGDLIVSDALNHASLVDGARLSRASVAVIPHLDAGAVEQALAARKARPQASGRAFVVTESYFSMDADGPDLGRLRAICDAHGAALVVDEAHALGVLGPEGGGLCAQSGISADVLVGTFGKAFGASGAFVAGCSTLVRWLWNRARPFVFSTGLSPAVAAAALEGIRMAAAEPQRRSRVLATAERVRSVLRDNGVRPAGFGHIIPWVLGEPSAAVRASEALRALGVHVGAIRPPSVPPGSSRLRITVTAAHGSAEIEHLAAALEAVIRGAPSWGG